MARTNLTEPPKIHRIPQPKFIDAIRWLPSPSPFRKSFISSLFDSDFHTPSLEIHSLDPSKTLTTPLFSWTPPSRISSLKSTPSLFAASTLLGSLHIFKTPEEMSVLGNDMSGLGGETAVMEPVVSVVGREFHVGSIGGVDLMEGGSECVSVGEDGRVNLVVEKGGFRRVFDGNGLVSYSAVKWASPSEFVTGGCGFGLQWWDLRQPGAAVAQFKGSWDHGTTSGIIHSIDIHPSRKHTCLAGGSSGTVFAWDLRRQQEPIILSSIGSSDTMTQPLSESEVWEVQYDHYTKSLNSNISSSRILPAMICSEDGILAVIEQGEEPTELLAEPCAINSFDIDRQNPSDVICSLEWESIVILSRP
ncbi:PREDICTED: nuclear pore complex protein NUP43-like [Populus euphratica]|uniref:Nuclear pore complex protein NUP43-like n=1 Tax=Populus euphratica TaxID=75702 RepID=A0AAJ6UNV6_POPEU|nr:PREDICTED: nuclear pore complex protein NUP43-like [Populus euphratica]XP_011033363.1 PREDICTED: nuclear pore complex protein NUP43-like [Populus euphratica]